MRDIKRIDRFCIRLANLWKANCPDWRFGQFIGNVFGDIASKGIDVFFPEEDKMIDLMKDCFPEYKEKKDICVLITDFDNPEPVSGSVYLIIYKEELMVGIYEDGCFKTKDFVLKKDNLKWKQLKKSSTVNVVNI